MKQTATILPFPTEQPGLSANLPSLNDMCYTLRQNWATLDDIDQNFARVIFRVEASGVRAKIETVAECRAMAWSMLTRYGLADVDGAA